MIDGFPRVLSLISAIGAGLAAGVFFAFSTFVMSGLRRAPSASAVAAMNGINRSADRSPLFMLLLFGTVVTAVLAVILVVRRAGAGESVWQIVGAGLYIVAILVTMVYHVPHNNALARLDPDSAAAARVWSHYVTSWTAWNHVRTLTCLAAAVCFTVSLRTGSSIAARWTVP